LQHAQLSLVQFFLLFSHSEICYGIFPSYLWTLCLICDSVNGFAQCGFYLSHVSLHITKA
jgi:hypothetical protein